MSKYSILRDSQKFLIIKTPDTGAAFVIADCYLPETAQTICNLLTKHELEMSESTQEVISKTT